MRVHVGPRVAHLPGLGEHARHHLVQLRDELELGVVGQVLERELALARVPRVRLAQHGVAVPGHDAPRLERVPHKLRHALRGDIRPNVALDFVQPLEHLLVGEAVQRPGEPVHARGERGVRVGERRTHQVRRVRGHVASLVVAVDGHVQAHQLLRALVVVAHLPGEVRRPVQGVVRRNQLTVLERVAVDGSRHGGELRDAV